MLDCPRRLRITTATSTAMTATTTATGMRKSNWIHALSDFYL
jgi:hypothetical protein